MVFQSRRWIASGWLLQFPDYELAQRIVDVTGAKVVSADRCFCSVYGDPTFDFIGMKPVDPCWGDLDRWWTVMFHELTHWMVLGLNRIGWRGDMTQGELIAELGAARLTDHCGIPMQANPSKDSVNLAAWIEGIRKNLWYFEWANDAGWMAAHCIVNLIERNESACVSPTT